MYPFSGERWWPAVLPVVATAALVGAAVALFGRRDVGAGLWPSRPGPQRAGRRLLGPLGLAWHLQRGSIIGWTVGILLLGVSYGSIGDDVEELMGSSELTEQMLRPGPNITDSFYAFAVVIIAVIASGFTISSALRPLGEEDAGRVETLLATAHPRRSWLLGHVAMTVFGSSADAAPRGLGLGLGYAMVTGDTDAITRYLGPMLSYLAPVLLLGGLARLLHGVVPRFGVPGLGQPGVLLRGDVLRRAAPVPAGRGRPLPVQSPRPRPRRGRPVDAGGRRCPHRRSCSASRGRSAFRRRDVITT